MRASVVILLMALAALGTIAACTAGGQAQAPAAPQARQEAGIILERYRNDPKLGDDLFEGKTVEIIGFQVQEIGEGTATMNDRGYSLRLEDLGDPTVKTGDVVNVVCEGDGMNDKQVIVFEGCQLR